MRWHTSCLIWICTVSKSTHVGLQGWKGQWESITKTGLYMYSFEPLKPHFYTAKLRLTGVYINYLVSAQNVNCGYLLEPPQRGGFNKYPQSMFWAEKRKLPEFFIGKFLFSDGKILNILNPYPAVHDNPYLCKQCRSRSDGFWRCPPIRIYTVCHSVCEFEQHYMM